MKKLVFISFLFVVLHSALYAQKGLSEEGYKHWIKAVALMENMKDATDYFLVLDEFSKVAVTDPTYADVYYNKGVLYAKMGELGGGIPMFDSAKTYYDKYLALRPSEKNTMLKELTQLEVKRENFIKSIGLNMVLIEGKDVKQGKNIINIKPFYIQLKVFTVADHKRLIMPMAVTVYNHLNKSNYNWFDFSNETNNLTADFVYLEQLIKILNYVTDRNYFVLTRNHLDLIKKNKIFRFGEAVDGAFKYGEWINDCKTNKDRYYVYWGTTGSYDDKKKVRFFRLALPATEK
jgi:tetratricopeptide (TPR) repeat protein